MKNLSPVTVRTSVMCATGDVREYYPSPFSYATQARIVQSVYGILTMGWMAKRLKSGFES
jgi:hypothetical protein